MKEPMKDYNACDDFFMTVLTSHIIAAALKYLQIHSPSQCPPECVLPCAEDMWTYPKVERRTIIEKICLSIVDEFINFDFNGDTKPKEDDGVKGYTEIVLSLGMFYWEYSDAIREGDGKRLLRCWRYMLPLFINTGRTNYSLEAFYLLYQHDYQLPPRLAQQLLYSRFVNVHGTSGRNIAADLYMEHLNAVAKGCIKNLGANKTESAITRAARALGTIVHILDNYDQQNNVKKSSGAHMSASAEKDQEMIVNELQTMEVFQSTTRTHVTFFKLRHPLYEKTLEELKVWIMQRLP